MTKKYNSPMLQVVSIKRSDIIATSGEETMGITSNPFTGTSGDVLSAGRRFDNWYEGY